MRPLLLVVLAASAALVLTSACHQGVATHVRGEDAPGLDSPAMGTGLDRRDLQRVFGNASRALVTSSFYARATSAAAARRLGLLPMLNQTTEHVDRQLDALLAKLETDLVARGGVTVVSIESQPDLVREIAREGGAAFDPSQVASAGRQLGVDYLLTGKVFDAAERTDDMRRVQYFLFLQVLDVETGQVVWADESAITKALVALP